MALRFLDEKSERFYFLDHTGRRRSFKLIFGDEIDTRSTQAPSGGNWRAITVRGRTGEIRAPRLRTGRSFEMYFLDVGQGDAAFMVTPSNTKILVDGGLQHRALGFLIWKYRLDQPGQRVTIDHLFLSHADHDHVDGLIPLLQHDDITVRNIWHNGIGVFNDPGFNTALGRRAGGRLTTRHSTVADLGTRTPSAGFRAWIDAVRASGANYNALDSTSADPVGDPDVAFEILGPVREDDGSYRWFGSKSTTINGHSLIFRATHQFVRVFFSGDLNSAGSRHLLAHPNAALQVNAHILKSPHHGSHDYHQPLIDAVAPMVTVISSGDSPDHGHPRASFLSAVGLAGRGEMPLVFSTEIAATFTDAGDAAAVDETEPSHLAGLDFSASGANTVARRRFKKTLSGIINVRSDGQRIYTARRVRAPYQWELYDPVEPVD